MKHLTIFLLLGFIIKRSPGQSSDPELFFGKYKGVEIRYYKGTGDTSSRVDRMNDTWGRKLLTLDSNGTFLLEFPVPYPTTRIGLTRSTKGKWTRIQDTLILNSHHPNSDFIKVKEKRVRRNHIQIKLTYTAEGVKYYPGLFTVINNQEEQLIKTRRSWTYFPKETVEKMEFRLYAGPTSTEREWFYKTVNKKSNHFRISVIDNIEGNNFAVENYKLLIRGAALVQIDRVFNLRENCFKPLP